MKRLALLLMVGIGLAAGGLAVVAHLSPPAYAEPHHGNDNSGGGH